MIYMNDWDIEQSVHRYKDHAVLGPATRFLRAYKEEVDSNSDGWPHWSPPVRAAAQLMTLIEKGSATPSELTKALVPIKAFMTRRGAAAGMKLPPIEVPS